VLGVLAGLFGCLGGGLLVSEDASEPALLGGIGGMPRARGARGRASGSGEGSVGIAMPGPEVIDKGLLVFGAFARGSGEMSSIWCAKS
jgi:hypothetical protein